MQNTSSVTPCIASAEIRQPCGPEQGSENRTGMPPEVAPPTAPRAPGGQEAQLPLRCDLSLCLRLVSNVEIVWPLAGLTCGSGSDGCTYSEGHLPLEPVRSSTVPTWQVVAPTLSRSGFFLSFLFFLH